MANNRMYIVHKQSWRAVYLGKRMGFGWYDVPQDLAERIALLFSSVKSEPGKSQDDFAIAMESAKNQPHVIDDWEEISEENGGKILMLEIGPTVKLAEDGAGI